MPGLAVILGRTSHEKNQADLERMVASMRHEDFYVSGTYADESRGLYVGWTVHPGSFSDCLPLRSEKGNFILFFYGEHLSVATGRKHSAAHELLQLFESHGLNCLPRLNGWFHGLFVDLACNEVTAFNDRYGMQRFYSCEDKDTVLFASEAKALLQVRSRHREIDPQGLGEFLSCGCVLENRSLFRGIKSLPAATVRTFAGAKPVRDHCYFSPRDWESQPALSSDEFHSIVQETLGRAVDRCVGSDLPMGFSLTGGFDTRLIMACLAKREALPCYTFGGMYRECFDVKIARKVARLSGCKHDVFELGSEFLRDFPQLAEKTVCLSDGCLSASNAYELYLNRLARQTAPVRLTGSYGSEVMRGARAFKALTPTPGLYQPDFAPHLQRASRTFDGASAGHPVSFSVFKQAPWYYSNRLAVEQSQVVVRTPFMDNDFVGLFYRRPDGFEESRAFAKRLIAERAPALAELPTDTGNCGYLRHQWAQFLFKADYCYKSGMPQWLEQIHHLCGPLQPEKLLIGRHRFAHFRVWFRDQLAGYVKEILLDPRTRARPYFDSAFVEQMVHRHIKGDRNYTDDIDRLITVELACRQFIDN